MKIFDFHCFSSYRLWGGASPLKMFKKLVQFRHRIPVHKFFAIGMAFHSPAGVDSLETDGYPLRSLARL